MDQHDTIRPDAPLSSFPATPMRPELGSSRGGSRAAKRPTREAPRGGPVSVASERGAVDDEETTPGKFIPWDELGLGLGLELAEVDRCCAAFEMLGDDE